MGFTYLCSPYSHPDPTVRHKRFEQVCMVAGRLMMAGEAIFCPIAHSHPIDLLLPNIQGYHFWMRQDLPILRHSDKVKVLMLDGWQDSKGIAHELMVAQAALIPIFYVEPDIEELDEIVRRAPMEVIDND